MYLLLVVSIVLMRCFARVSFMSVSSCAYNLSSLDLCYLRLKFISKILLLYHILSMLVHAVEVLL